jgi:nitrile hydratase
MDGIHDLGGMDGFGPVEWEPDWHDGEDGEGYSWQAKWEKHVWALMWATAMQGDFNVDEFRYAIECLPPAEYLDTPYYGRWLRAVEMLLIEDGVITESELKAARDSVSSGDGVRQMTPHDEVNAQQLLGVYEHAGEPQTLRFEPGDEIAVRNIHHDGHTRAPRYARRARGTVKEVLGMFSLPDDKVRHEQTAEPVYSVRFDAAELWGNVAEENTTVYLDMWESYLEPTGRHK